MRLLCLLGVLIASLNSSRALVPWSPLQRQRQQRQQTGRLARLSASSNDYFHDDGDALDQTRRRLEAMMGADSTPSLQDEASQTPVMERRVVLLDANRLPDPPILTAIGKERRIAEIQLLARLADSDESMDDLWALWFSERGPKAAQELHQIDELTAEGPRVWAQAEERLLALVEEHGLDFSEAVNRLATLYFLWGRLEESRAACEIVLQAKPWHVGALSGIVRVHAGLGEAAEARQWAARRMPPLQPTGTNRRRREWVERALNDSTRSLLQAEKYVKMMFGVPDRRFKVNTFDDHNAWQ